MADDRTNTAIPERRRLGGWCLTHDDAVPHLGNCCSMGGYYGEWDDCVTLDRFAAVPSTNGSEEAPR